MKKKAEGRAGGKVEMKMKMLRLYLRTSGGNGEIRFEKALEG